MNNCILTGEILWVTEVIMAIKTKENFKFEIIAYKMTEGLKEGDLVAVKGKLGSNEDGIYVTAEKIARLEKVEG